MKLMTINIEGIQDEVEKIVTLFFNKRVELAPGVAIVIHGDDPLPRWKIEGDSILLTWSGKVEIDLPGILDPDVKFIRVWKDRAEVQLRIGRLDVKFPKSKPQAYYASGEEPTQSIAMLREHLQEQVDYYASPEGRKRRRGWSKRRCRRVMQDDAGYGAWPAFLMPIFYSLIWAVIKEMAMLLYRRINAVEVEEQ